MTQNRCPAEILGHVGSLIDGSIRSDTLADDSIQVGLLTVLLDQLGSLTPGREQYERLADYLDQVGFPVRPPLEKPDRIGLVVDRAEVWRLPRQKGAFEAAQEHWAI